ncbi:hypothetical protein SAMN05192573_1156 [Mucilaginibacter gossypii]|uniref:Uncharacterized protein n=1 Tax=Mucilaginibacter gossypii TaxID=551996 RepID=A0A1G8H1B6_9SPHI|nr:hypothetical protein SAMN05192573_1156 [Mucilaginibacter gossypii]
MATREFFVLLFYLKFFARYVFSAVIVKSFIGTHYHKNAMFKGTI